MTPRSPAAVPRAAVSIWEVFLEFLILGAVALRPGSDWLIEII